MTQATVLEKPSDLPAFLAVKSKQQEDGNEKSKQTKSNVKEVALDQSFLKVAKLYKTTQSSFTFQTIHQVNVLAHWDEQKLSPLTVDWQLSKQSHGFSLSGSAVLLADIPCDRCTKPFSVSLPLTLDESFVLSSTAQQWQDDEETKVVSGQEIEIQSFAETVDPLDEINLSDLVTEYVTMALSEKLLCQQATCDIP